MQATARKRGYLFFRGLLPVADVQADAAALTVHLGVLDWEQVYADWAPDDPLRYYWRPLPLPIQPAWHTVANQR